MKLLQPESGGADIFAGSETRYTLPGNGAVKAASCVSGSRAGAPAAGADGLTIIAPGSPEATLANPAWTLTGTL